MLSQSLVAAVSLLPLSQAETVLGVYMFHRHGDRTAKSWPPANLTVLGQAETYTSGNYYRDRYISSSASDPIFGINTDIVKNSQLAFSAPADTVLQDSTTSFLQGLYPPVGPTLGSQTLRNGTNITSPLNGYQLVPISLVTSGTGSEDSGWLQASTGCSAATVSSNEYFSSPQYTNLLQSTQDFYNNLTPVVNGTFNQSQISFKNAYTIFDLINVAQINNVTNYNSSDLITPDVFYQLRTLADQHEWNLAYNSSNNARAIAGMTLAAEITQFLNTTLSGASKPKLGVQFGNYATFASYFGLAGLDKVSADFTAVADYASSMAFELVTNASVSSSAPIPSDQSQIAVRFLFHNGTASAASPPTAYPLFGSQSLEMPWTDFVSNMAKVSVGSTQQWCQVCQNTTGTCAAYASGTSSSASSASSTAGTAAGNGLSPAVNGVIGAMVTLAVILGLEALVLLVAGLRVVRKRKSAVGAVADGEMVKA